MFKRTMMSPDERAEYDRIFEESCLDEHGEMRRTADAAQELLTRVRDAIQAHRTWASYVHDDLVMSGYKTGARQWQNELKKHKTIVNNKIVSRKDAIRLRRNQPDGSTGWQTSLLDEATADDLAQMVTAANVRVVAERATVRDYMRLIDLLDSTGEVTVRAALKRIGKSLDEFLTSESA